MKKQNLLILVFSIVVSTVVSCNKCVNSQTDNAGKEMSSDTGEISNIDGRQSVEGNVVITPLPAIMIATYDDNNNPDVMMAAWGGQCGPNHICFELSPHKTTDNIIKNKEFTVSFATQNDVAESDYFGTVSANDVPDKVKKVGFTTTKSLNVNAPIINEYKLALECKVVSMDENGRGGYHVVGEVINMSADPSILDEKGLVDLDKLKPIIFDSSKNIYRSVGDKVGDAWGAGSKYKD